MRKSWPFALAVIVVGSLAGAAIAGRPVPSDSFVLDESITNATDSVPTSDADPTTTTTKVTTTIASTTTEQTTTSEADTTVPVTVELTTTTDEVTTTTVARPLPREEVRLVIANGDGRFRLATITADRLRPFGYVIDLGDTLQMVDATVIYYRPGFDDEAEIVATDVEVPNAIIAAFPANAPQPITNADASGDVILVLGPDAPR